MTTKSCGTCAMCCKLLIVAELEKPACQWCEHARPGNPTGACGIYEERPRSCQDFECLWLHSHDVNPLSPSLRPDKSKVVMMMGGADRDDLVLHVDPGYPNAWREHGEIVQIVNAFLKGGKEILVVCGDRRKLLSNNPDSERVRLAGNTSTTTKGVSNA